MSDFEKQLNKVAKDIKLSVAEKRELQARVVSFMEYHPRREKVAAEKAQAYLASQPYSILSFNNRYLQAALGTFAVFVFIVVPTVAEQAVPGDVLYPIKVRVNEEVRGSLTFSPTQKIEWETERLERRIAEVRLLESKGELTPETEAEAVKAVQAHAEAVQDGINKLRDTDAEEASLAEVAFVSALDVQSSVLESDNKTTTDVNNNDKVDELEQVVKNAKAVAAAAQGTTTPSYDKLIARLEIETTRAYELFKNLDGAATDNEKTEIERRLADIERKIQSGKVDKKTGVESLRLVNALSDTRKLISFMTDIDVRSSVLLETLVPIERTDEEKTQLVQENKEVVEEAMAAIELVDEESIDQSILEKVSVGVKNIEMLDERLNQAITESDFDAQVAISNEMKVMAEDIEKLLLPFMDDIDVKTDVDVQASSTATTTDVSATSSRPVGTTTTSTTTNS